MVGKPRALVHFFIVIAGLAIALAIGSRILNTAIGMLGIAFLLVGSVAALWKAWSKRGQSSGQYVSITDWLASKEMAEMDTRRNRR